MLNLQPKLFFNFFSSTFRNIEIFLFSFALEIGYFEFFKKDKKTSNFFGREKLLNFKKNVRVIRKMSVSYGDALLLFKKKKKGHAIL